MKLGDITFGYNKRANCRDGFEADCEQTGFVDEDFHRGGVIRCVVSGEREPTFSHAPIAGTLALYRETRRQGLNH